MSERDNDSVQTAPAATPVAAGYLGDVGNSLARAVSGAWMVTFTDLVALMLTFFVLLFSMSVVEQYKWQNLVRSLAGQLDSIQAHDKVKPAVAFQIAQDLPQPGTDLNYLAPVIEQQLAAEPALARGAVRLQAGQVVLSLPAGTFFDTGSRALAPRANAAVYALSRLLQTLGNRVEIHGHEPGGATDGPAWDLSLARAAALADAVRERGYRSAIVARGYGSLRQDEASDGAGKDRLNIVVLGESAGGG
jgi:chemotaxis protein MotB